MLAGYPSNDVNDIPIAMPTLPVGTVPPEEVEQQLLEYFQDACESDEPLFASQVQELLVSASGPLPWHETEDGTLLHQAVMAEGCEPQELFAIVSMLLQAGAPPLVKDGDGDTALGAVVSLAEANEDKGEDMNNDTPEKQANMAALRALLSSPLVPVDRSDCSLVCSWLRRLMPRGPSREQVLQCLSARVGEAEVRKMWSSEGLLEYLEGCAYEKKCGVKADHVAQFLERGASPSHAQNGATSLLLVVLNPYCHYTEVDKVFRLMMAVDPAVATTRDAFKLAPFQWASDHENIALQHGLKRTNPAALLALVPVILATLPAEIDIADTAVTCLKVKPNGASIGAPKSKSGSPDLPPLRFIEGDRVVCCVQIPGGNLEWEEGGIVGLWYREDSWPPEFPGAPYEVLLDLGYKVYALADHDHLVRREVATSAKYKYVTTDVKTTQNRQGKSGAASRFQRRQREDGKWEMLDTVSGRTRLIMDSDSDD